MMIKPNDIKYTYFDAKVEEIRKSFLFWSFCDKLEPNLTNIVINFDSLFFTWL